jgi:hypothetical protein
LYKILELIFARKKAEEEKENQKEFFYEFLKLFRKQNKKLFRPPNFSEIGEEEKTYFSKPFQNQHPHLSQILR